MPKMEKPHPKPKPTPAGPTAPHLEEPHDQYATAAPAPITPAPEKLPLGRATLLTPELQQRIVSYIRAGAFDWVAAEANGVSRKTFWEWLARGEGEDPDRPQTPLYAEFVEQVRAARAEARLSAEVEVKRGEPLSWLMKGPGRHQPDAPGWTSGDGDGAAVMTAIQIEIVHATRDGEGNGDANVANAAGPVRVTGIVQRCVPPRP
jgi:hypothetical protein